MNILIIEDERPAAEKLIKLLEKIDKSITIAAIIETVEGTINWMQGHSLPDLILMDIQLDDGLCFEIFETINIESPIIFTTAYDQYTLKAFKVNSVDYLLKPIEEEPLKLAINKFKNLHLKKPVNIDFDKLVKGYSDQYKSRFLVKIGNRYRSIPANEISHFYICERSTFIKNYQGKEYAVDYSLEQLQNILNPDKFFRINRNCIINIDSVTEMYSYSSSRLQLSLINEEKNEIFVVSRDKVRSFKRWIDR